MPKHANKFFDKCCCRVNIKRGNYIFGIVNAIFRFTLFASLWAAANVDIEDVYKISVATVSAWMLASFVACLFMIIGIWKHEPMLVIPFLIIIYTEFVFVVIGTVAAAATFGYQRQETNIALCLSFGLLLTGLYQYYSFLLYSMYKQMLGNALARYVYIC